MEENRLLETWKKIHVDYFDIKMRFIFLDIFLLNIFHSDKLVRFLIKKPQKRVLSFHAKWLLSTVRSE
jgi:hypothetical protein